MCSSRSSSSFSSSFAFSPFALPTLPPLLLLSLLSPKFGLSVPLRSPLLKKKEKDFKIAGFSFRFLSFSIPNSDGRCCCFDEKRKQVHVNCWLFFYSSFQCRS